MSACFVYEHENLIWGAFGDSAELKSNSGALCEPSARADFSFSTKKRKRSSGVRKAEHVNAGLGQILDVFGRKFILCSYFEQSRVRTSYEYLNLSNSKRLPDVR